LGLGAEQTQRALDGLLDSGLIEVVSARRRRYRIPTAVHRHAAAEAEIGLDAAGLQAVRRGYADYYAAGAGVAAERWSRRWTVLERLENAPETPGPVSREEAGRWLDENLDASLACSVWAAEFEWHDLVMRFAEACDSPLRERGRYTDAVALMERGIQAAVAAGNWKAEARIRDQQGLILLELRGAAGVDAAITQFSKALKIAEEAGDVRGQAAALECLGIAEQYRKSDEEALGYFDRARPFKEAMQRPQAVAILALHSARSQVNLGRSVGTG